MLEKSQDKYIIFFKIELRNETNINNLTINILKGKYLHIRTQYKKAGKWVSL